MRRAAVLVLVLLSVAGAASGALAGFPVVTSAEADAITTHSTDGGFTVVVDSVSGNITCPAGQTFTGKANARTAGSTKFVGRFSGDCTGAEIKWHTDLGQSFGTIPCSGQVTVGGQVQVSDGTKLILGKTSFAVALLEGCQN